MSEVAIEDLDNKCASFHPLSLDMTENSLNRDLTFAATLCVTHSDSSPLKQLHSSLIAPDPSNSLRSLMPILHQ